MSQNNMQVAAWDGVTSRVKCRVNSGYIFPAFFCQRSYEQRHQLSRAALRRYIR